MALDAERELLFVPTGSATPDFYGASRPGGNLFANCLLALDARTGELRWYFQAVHHDLWDRDLPAPPTLVQVERFGVVIDAVAVTTKSGHLFVFDRDTGKSLYDIAEVSAPPSDLPGEQASPDATGVQRRLYPSVVRDHHAKPGGDRLREGPDQGSGSNDRGRPRPRPARSSTRHTMAVRNGVARPSTRMAIDSSSMPRRSAASFVCTRFQLDSVTETRTSSIAPAAMASIVRAPTLDRAWWTSVLG